MDFQRAVVVGQESAAARLLPREERLGRKTERFEDRVPVRGSAPKDVAVGMGVESPHVKWAKPYSRGKTRVMVLTSCLNGREAVEMAQRMDIELVWVTAGMDYEMQSFSGVLGGGRNVQFRTEHTNQYIKEQLVKPCDVALIGGLQGSLFTDETLDLLRKKVEEGMGLVYVAPNRSSDKLYALLPVEKEVHVRRPAADWKAVKPHFITTGVPFDALPKTDYAEFKAKVEPLALIGKHPLLVAQDGPGKGRVVVLTYNKGWQG